MGVVLLFVCLLVASLIILVVSKICREVFYKKYDTTRPNWGEESSEIHKKYSKKSNQAYNGYCVGIGMSILMGMAVIGLCVAMMGIHLPSNQVQYNRTKMEYDMLQYRVEHIEDNNVGNELLYNDIVEFNKELYDIKRMANNKWINWFVVEQIAELDYIKIEEDH